MKIGQLVKSYIPQIFEYCATENIDELYWLMDEEYSNKVFGLNWEFCAEEDSHTLTLFSKRFWKKEYVVIDKVYRVCSQWNIKHKTKFLNYLLDHQIINEEKHHELDRLVQHNQTRRHGKSKENSVEFINKQLDDTLESYFDPSLLAQARHMMSHYQKFYCLERSIRDMIKEVMLEEYGENWWSRVDAKVRSNVSNNMEYELDTTHTKRSNQNIDYTTFGDLRKIINSQWKIFEPKFKRNLNSVNEVMYDFK